LVAGVDEVGRGSLFGPVVAAAVILAPAYRVRGLRDSKLLLPERREILAERIRQHAIAWAIAAVDAARIDQINIYQASRVAMLEAVTQLNPSADHLLIDALRLDSDVPQRAIIHGDALSASIAAASILAKVERDRMVREWDPVFPVYRLASNKGYSTPHHLAALRQHGPDRGSVADWRQGAVPEALPRVLLHGPQRVLGILLGLVFVEQRHDLPDHVAYRIVAEFLGDRHQAHAVLGEPPDVELKLELVAEEAAEAVHDDHFEHRWLGRGGVDHALELGPAVVRGGCAGFNVGLDKLVAARLAIGFALPLLIWNGDVLGLPRRRDPQVEGGA